MNEKMAKAHSQLKKDLQKKTIKTYDYMNSAGMVLQEAYTEDEYRKYMLKNGLKKLKGDSKND